MTKDEFVAALRDNNACWRSVAWVNAQDTTPYNMWRNCQRGDWLLWLADVAVGNTSRVADAGADLFNRLGAFGNDSQHAYVNGYSTTAIYCQAKNNDKARKANAQLANIVRMHFKWSGIVKGLRESYEFR